MIKTITGILRNALYMLFMEEKKNKTEVIPNTVFRVL